MLGTGDVRGAEERERADERKMERRNKDLRIEKIRGTKWEIKNKYDNFTHISLIFLIIKTKVKKT